MMKLPKRNCWIRGGRSRWKWYKWSVIPHFGLGHSGGRYVYRPHAGGWM